MTLTFGSLFAGIGGFDLGLERAGFECRWQVENDPYCTRVLERHWPDVPKYGDVHGVSGSTLEAVDAICGGFPCQPVSLAGRREGTSDARWLWPEYARLVGEIRPRYVIVENVPGLYSKGGCEVVADLATLGYDIEWDRISAEAVGAPHKRERFILVAYRDVKRSSGRENSRLGAGVGEAGAQSPRSRTARQGGVVADSNRQRRQQVPGRSYGDEEADAGRRTQDDHQSQCHGEGDRARGILGTVALGRVTDYWDDDPANSPESSVGRVADGVPNRVDRIRSLGNALVPQVAEVVGRAIIEWEKGQTDDSRPEN